MIWAGGRVAAGCRAELGTYATRGAGSALAMIAPGRWRHALALRPARTPTGVGEGPSPGSVTSRSPRCVQWKFASALPALASSPPVAPDSDCDLVLAPSQAVRRRVSAGFSGRAARGVVRRFEKVVALGRGFLRARAVS